MSRYRINHRKSKYSAYTWYYVEKRRWFFFWDEVDWFKTREDAEKAIANVP